MNGGYFQKEGGSPTKILGVHLFGTEEYLLNVFDKCNECLIWYLISDRIAMAFSRSGATQALAFDISKSSDSA